MPNRRSFLDCPWKLLREMTLSMEGAIACVDYAAKRNFQYIMLDWGWYGDPFDAHTYARYPVNHVWFFNKTDRAKNHEICVPEIIKYADGKGIGVVLYIDRRIVENQLDEVLPIYKEWGVKAIKFGFVNTGPQKWTKWLLDAVRKCADYGISVNILDAYRTTGFSRTYPNLLTQEGIRGNEHMPTSRHNATLPFTRFVAGAGDYTICYFTDRKQTTHAHQLAMSVIVYSPMQSVFWYDVPADDKGEPELEFFDVLPTVWDETRVIDGEIGEYVIIARRKGDEWFVGAITNEQERELSFRLNFLDANVPYIVKMYGDDPENQVSRTKVKIQIQEVQPESQIKLNLSANGGQAMHVIPKQEVAANK
jgi:alpha-glucosidase